MLLFDQLDFRCGGKAPIKQMKVASLSSIEHNPLYFIGAILYSDSEGEAYYISGGDAVFGWTFTKFGSGGSTVDTVLSDAANESISGNSANQKEVNLEVKSFTEHYKDSLVKADVGLGAYPDLPADLPIQSAQATVNSNVQTSLTHKEDSLGNPLQDNYILVSMADGTRSWKDPREVNAYTAQEITVDTSGTVLTYDLENKMPMKIPVITARQDFEIVINNMRVGDTFQLILQNDTDTSISVKLPKFLSLVNAGDVGQVARWTLDKRTNTIKEGVNLSNNVLTSYIWSIAKAKYNGTFAIESAPGTKTGQEYYMMSIGESGNVSFYNQ